MICIVETPLDLANFVELNNLVVNLKGESDGETSVTALGWADFAKMVKGEKLYLLAHASSTAIGESPEYTGPEFAKELLDRNLPGHIAKIILVACETGVSPGLSRAPLCQVIANQLSTQSQGAVKVPVTGFSDSAVTNQLGQTRAIDPTKMAKFQGEYDAIGKKWKTKLKEWEAQASRLPTNTQSELIEGSRLMARASKPFFAELYAVNEKLVKSKTHSKVYGRPS